MGNPARFFAALKAKGLEVIAHPFPDHYDFKPEDICFNDDIPVVMTEKDAVKCRAFLYPQQMNSLLKGDLVGLGGECSSNRSVHKVHDYCEN
ncbi:MAG TPA: tetraacyldisaccharide 4'-kinase, partial [Candidatus Berkiella sp.]|nr:tetraacyldisaccharide 4'-kinase [Candidatus Berkiella sp.]